MKNKRKLEDLTTDEFLEQGLLSDSDDDYSAQTSIKSSKKSKTVQKKKNITVSGKKKQSPSESPSVVNGKKKKRRTDPAAQDSGKRQNHADEKEIRDKSTGNQPSKHKASLEKLKDQDPEFYQFLQQEDQNLLDFEDSDDGEVEDEDSDDSEAVDFSEEDDEMDSSGSEEKLPKSKKIQLKSKKSIPQEDSDDYSTDEEGKYHSLPEKLETMSDSDDENEDDLQSMELDMRTRVTLKMINQWTDQLRGDSYFALRDVVEAFRATVQQAGSKKVKSKFIVKGSASFNAMIRLCIRDMPPMLGRFLKEPKVKDSNKVLLPSHSPQYKQISFNMSAYLTTLLELLNHVAEPNIMKVLLKHVHQMVPYYAGIPKLTKALLRKLIRVWSTDEEALRVLSFISINKLIRLRKDTFLEFAIKQMYITYVKNCKFTSPTTLPLINFMQHSLVEIFAIDHNLTYQCSFMYIRQLAIHLRNAITVKKKDTCQSVYNWQYIHSLNLWAMMLSRLHPSEALQPLIYPLIQVTIGTIKLIPTARYFPLRFHCVRVLNMISASTGTFIPILPFLVEIFDITNFNKKYKSISFRPFNFACILKLTKAQLVEKTFRDDVIDQLYEHLMETLHVHAHTLGFPELVFPAMVQMKNFVKTCKVAPYTKQIKQIVDKVEETSKVILLRRKAASLSLTDKNAVESWERKSKQEGTPLGKYYATWRKLRDRELVHAIAGKERISTDDLPHIDRRPKAPETANEEDRKEFADLFNTDSEDSDDETRFLMKGERPKKQKKVSHDDSDDASELDEEDMALLDRSASEDEEDEGEGEDEASIEMETDSGSDTEADSNEDAGKDEDEDSDFSNAEDIVEDFKFSSDDDED